ncbi:MAG: transglutaminaseTgpA domain-containing protein [Actinomycetota bacterium]
MTRLTLVGALAAALAVLPLVPITDRNGWLVPAAFGIGLVSLAGWAIRRIGSLNWPVVPAQLGVLLLWLGLLVAADVAWLGVIPTWAWLERLGAVASEGVSVIMEHAAPVPVERPMLFIIVAGAGLVAIAVEFAVFLLRQVPLAGLPLALMYGIAASVANEGWSWLWFVPPAAGFLALLITEGRNRVAAWGLSAGPSAPASAGRARPPETDSLARNGRRVGTLALAAAVVVPAVVPALTAGGISGGLGTGSGGGHTIRTDNPIVDLQRDLTRPDNVPVLRYTTDSEEPEYIRTAALDVFDGEEWATSDRTVSTLSPGEELPLPPGVSVAADGPPTASYDIEVTENFSSTWLPLVYPAYRIDIDGDWQYHAATLDVVADDGEDIQGIDYAVESIVFARDASDLREAPPSDDPVQFRQQFDQLLELPAETREMLEPFVDEAVGDETNPYEQAAALQSWFRTDGGFEYSLETPPGTSSSAMLDFLEDRSGYCEQYAATMAIMARYLGIPARVAVGFTPGDRQDAETWVVRAHDAHAWPELYFSGVGWIRFEPTPATRTGSAPDWTVPPAEDENTADDEDAQAGSPDVPEGQLPPGLQDQFGADAGAAGTFDTQPSRWPLILLGLGVVALVFTAPAAIAWALRTRRWRRAGGDPALQAEAAWADLRDAVRDAGMRWDRSATPRRIEHYVASRALLGTDGQRLLNRLAMATERARYAARADQLPDLRTDAAKMRVALLRPLPWWAKLRAWLWPVAVSDLMVTVVYAVSDGLAWLDTAGERLRVRLGRG